MTAPTVAQSTDNHRRTIILLWMSAATLLLLTWWAVMSAVGSSQARELSSAEKDLSNLTRVSEEHATRTFRSADQVIRFVQARYLEIGDRLDLKALTESGVIDAEIFNQVGVIDAHGIYRLSNLPINGRLDLSDREHFKVHAASDTGELFVSKPVLGRASGKWSIQLTRRISRPTGEFAGVVVLSIDPGYFIRFYGDLKLGREGLAALYGLDGVARARIVGPREAFGSVATASPMFIQMARGELQGSYINRSVVDGIERMYYWRKIPGYALMVVAGLDTNELLTNHLQFRQVLGLEAALVSVLIIALATALTRYLLAIRRAMAARQSAILQIQDRTEQLNAIFALSPDGFVSFDRDRRVKYVSPAFAKLTALGDVRLEGLSETEFSAWLSGIGNPSIPFVGVGDLRAKVTGGNADAKDVIELSKEGKRILQVGLRCSESNSVSQILYFRDVTHETEVDQMKSEFLSTAAHELRTPMASIYGFAEILLADEEDADTRKEFLKIIYQQAGLMANILNELLDLARIEARRGKDFRYVRICLQDLITELVKAFSRPTGRELHELVMPQQPLYVTADVGKLKQAIVNVLSNAYKYSPAGGAIRLEIEAGCEAGQPPQVCIQITDRGIGMNQEQAGRVFERFYRADSSGKIPGTGLGMSIVKEIIELHHGHVAIHTTEKLGTRVSLCLPVESTAQVSPDLPTVMLP